MCRLYGFIASEETGLECSLVEAQNALIVQSDRDLRGIRNPDGWGLAAWDNDRPGIVKSTFPAFADREFGEIASSVFSKAAIAHIRAATVGEVAFENTHPFQYGPWVFAHNGTLASFEHLRTHLDLGVFGPPSGTTDSETIFLWLLNRMARHGLNPLRPAEDLLALVELLHDAVSDLIQISIRAGVEQQPTLNFMIGDGSHLAASRWGNSLHWTYRVGVTDCEVCGVSHCPTADETYRSVVVASEPITNEEWIEIPEGTIFGAGPDAATITRSLTGTVWVPA